MPRITTLTETKGREVRTRFINQGMAVTPLAYDPKRDVYVFDVQMDLYTPRQFGLLYLASRRRQYIAEHHDVAYWYKRLPSEEALRRGRARKLRKYAAAR